MATTLYHLIKKFRGKETIVMTDQLRKVQDHKKKIESSQRGGIKGQRVEYTIVKAEDGETEKYKKPPHKINLSPTSEPRLIPKRKK